MDDDDLERYRNHPLVKALAADQHLLARRRVPPVPRDGKGRVMKGFTANPHGRPPGRVSLRAAFHRYGLDGLAKLNALADDPRLTLGQRAVIYAEQVRLAYSLRSIRSDASAKRKLEQQEREHALHMATLAVFARAGVPAREFYEWRAAKSKPGAAPVPLAPRAEAQAPPATCPPASSLPEAAGGEAKVQPKGEVPASSVGAPPAGPGQTPRRQFWISTPL